jgi:tetratricopeptide (TPR) repeat protein
LNNRQIHYSIVFITLLLLTACSAQKNTGLSRAYHNLTSKYNVLFNGSESYKDGLYKIEKEYSDDYSQILPIFNYGGDEIVDLTSSDMDRTIKKCSKLITLHSITAKPKVKDNKTLSPEERAFFSKKEYNVFVDDAYLLMGKAHFYKHEYPLAAEIFRRVLNDFKNQSTIPETQVWLARVSIETGQYIEASDILTVLNNNADFPKKLFPELYPTYADFYLKQKDYGNAISFLEKSLVYIKQKKVKTRYLFILAQLYEKTGDLKRASEYYDQVIKMNPVYEMAFNAHINRALAYEQGFGRADDIESELIKMLNDDKNIDYQDQIYYALGNLAIKEGNESKALEYYVKSIETNKGNDQQKVRSYLILADHFYNIPDYPKAQAYYDSAVSKIEPDYPGYNIYFTKSKSLTRLVHEINVVTLGDSVLLLAQLPGDELNSRIDALIADKRRKDEDEKQKQQNKVMDEQFDQEIAMNSAAKQESSSGSQWYFYNDAAKTMGYKEFRLKWGNRRLEDHWQRASKAMVSFIPGEEIAVNESESGELEIVMSPFSRDYYMAGIPLTDSARNLTYNSIEEALYNMGMIYKDELKDYDKANDSFKSLIKRFPKSDYLLASYYNLYIIARDQNNPAMMDYYKGIIARQFPESTYAKVLTDPEYFNNLEKEDRKIREYYEQTYALYLAGNNVEVHSRTNEARKLYPEHALFPLFTYLGILAEGKMTDQNVFRDSLLVVAAKYPGTEIAADARNLISYMDQEHPEFKEAEEIKISKELYSETPVSDHYFVFALPKQISTNQLVFNIINYNLDYSDAIDLIVEVIRLNNEHNLITVKMFPDEQKAKLYLNGIVNDQGILKDMPEIEMLPFIISDKNLVTLKDDKSVDRYLKFYNEYYE